MIRLPGPNGFKEWRDDLKKNKIKKKGRNENESGI